MAATIIGVAVLATAGAYTVYQAYSASKGSTPSAVPVTDVLNKGTEADTTTRGKGNWSGSTRTTQCGRGRVTSPIDSISYTNGTLKTFTSCMAIGSYGDEYPSNTNVAKKKSLITDKTYKCLSKVKTDLDRFKALVENDPDKELFDVFEDKPGLKCQKSRDFYFLKIAHFLSECDEPGGKLNPVMY